jgi:DNA-nicking Smr family endonuclease
MSRKRIDRPRRRLSEDEELLWSGITRSVVPLKRKASGAAAHHRGTHAAERAAPQGARRRTEPIATRPAPAKSSTAGKPAPSIGSLDRRQKQRLARGAEPIDARIDLHGHTQSEAHAALLFFLRRAQAAGARFVLVVTGKGGFSGRGPSAERGILKRQVPLWLRQAEFRPYVLAAEDAHRAHGGEGALYIRIRRGK